jgi:hypothetical protein
VAFAEWLRVNSQHYLLEASEREMAQRYLGAAPPPIDGGLETLFWRKVFVPVYHVVPWSWRRWIMQMMPGSHRRQWTYRPSWKGRAPPPSDPSP